MRSRYAQWLSIFSPAYRAVLAFHFHRISVFRCNQGLFTHFYGMCVCRRVFPSLLVCIWSIDERCRCSDDDAEVRNAALRSCQQVRCRPCADQSRTSFRVVRVISLSGHRSSRRLRHWQKQVLPHFCNFVFFVFSQFTPRALVDSCASLKAMVQVRPSNLL